MRYSLLPLFVFGLATAIMATSVQPTASAARIGYALSIALFGGVVSLALRVGRLEDRLRRLERPEVKGDGDG